MVGIGADVPREFRFESLCARAVTGPIVGEHLCHGTKFFFTERGLENIDHADVSPERGSHTRNNSLCCTSHLAGENTGFRNGNPMTSQREGK
ncbi:hypothetical protein [Streptomyces sp. DH-12]|uniref:hypothetical protein n=1 Tax=Streptomyces sp. DH-12 TaxID=2072509 RepID=UPI001F52C940|nr:hypothetical protein [Streptomyces sp. DH-12]